MGSDHDHGGGAGETPVALKARLEGLDAGGDRFELGALEEGDGKEELIPDGQADHEHHRHEARPGEGENDLGHDLEVVGAVDARRLFEVGGD